MKTELASLLAEEWVRAASDFGRAAGLQDHLSDALKHLLPDEATDGVVMAGPDLPAVIVLNGSQLFVVTPSDRASKPMVEVETLPVRPAYASLSVKRDQVTLSAGGLSTVSMRHRWKLCLTNFDREIVFDGNDVVEKGPDRAQRLGIALAQTLQWQLPDQVKPIRLGTGAISLPKPP